MTVDLNTCGPGQLLKSKHGTILTYVEKLPEGNFYDHKVRYPNGAHGTRYNNGLTYKPQNSLETDEDIVEILPFEN